MGWEEASTCLVSDQESVRLAQGRVCCLLGALRGEKREQRRWHHLGAHPSSLAFPGHRHRPRGSRGCAEVPGLQEWFCGGFWGQEGLGSSPSASLLGLSFLFHETLPGCQEADE